MILADLIRQAGVDLTSVKDRLNAFSRMEIQAITADSRQVVSGSLFFAVKGLAADGHDYIDTAIKNGAALVIAQENPEDIEQVIVVKDSRKAFALTASAFYGHPSRDMMLIGITGTNGKTTTTWLLESIFTACGYKCGVIGTVNIRYNGKTLDNPITTPDALVLQKTLAEMKGAGVTHVVMEVSSHGLAQYRVEGCNFDTAIFTNLTQDHLDYHPDMNDYFQTKKRLFTLLGTGQKSRETKKSVVNINDAYGQKLADELGPDTLTVCHEPCSGQNRADILAADISDTIQGLSAKLSFADTTLSLSSPLTGRFNLKRSHSIFLFRHALRRMT